jgi:hypothetical protein
MFGYLSKFYYESEPALLFIASGSELNELANFIKKLAVENPRTSTRLSNPNFFQSMNDTAVWIKIDDLDCGGKKIESATGNEVRWTISFEDAIRFTSLINDVSNSNESVHQYLDSQSGDEFNVIVSKNEYTNKVFEEHI